MACPFDTVGLQKNEREKVEHYQDLKVEMQKMRNCICCSNLNWALAVGAVTENFMMWFTEIGTLAVLHLFQKACLLGTAKVLRRTLET